MWEVLTGKQAYENVQNIPQVCIHTRGESVVAVYRYRDMFTEIP